MSYQPPQLTAEEVAALAAARYNYSRTLRKVDIEVKQKLAKAQARFNEEQKRITEWRRENRKSAHIIFEDIEDGIFQNIFREEATNGPRPRANCGAGDAP